jgi:hypothetical protein
MYIEFKFCEESGPDLLLIRYRLVKWAIQFDINYKEHTTTGTHCVTFNKKSQYTIFILTWPIRDNYRIIYSQNSKI